MDPNEALRLLRLHYKEIMRLIDKTNLYDRIDESGDNDLYDFMSEANSLSEVAEALDGWLSKKGFLPDDWEE